MLSKSFKTGTPRRAQKGRRQFLQLSLDLYISTLSVHCQLNEGSVYAVDPRQLYILNSARFRAKAIKQ